MEWTVIGIIAGAITTSAFFPQIYRGYKTKSLGDLSYFMMISLVVGMSLWLLYGMHLGDMVIILANSVGIILNITLIVMKYHFSKTAKIRKGD